MEIDRADGRTPNQLRPLSCSRGVLHHAHGSTSWSQGTKKNENPERASFEVIWKPNQERLGNRRRNMR
ncbi:hypothetical protein MLD38_014658 [Melastoma candidum]|uniref:Uncharacterized protein n=1 Tax=Melastoma candidum TaxID=119954 RepID=A0ACB9RLY7_9MYRT|nr:hypothetical protein MLD38_014658 [Melastoma candidum]